MTEPPPTLSPSPSPDPNAPVPSIDSTGRPQVPDRRRRRTLEGLTAFVLAGFAMPLGLAVHVAASRRLEQDVADSVGLTVVLVASAGGTLLGWHARQRVGAPGSAVYGMTSSTLAMYAGLGILTACALVMLRIIFPAR